ncbi:MAG: IS110 family transposase [Chitinophagaceae bacterium]|nr:MAG: IS110 family transposase [Chitinophagaceae bacterium]
MNRIVHFIGIDVSKETLDIALIKNNDKSHVCCFKVSNNPVGFKKMKRWLTAEKVTMECSVFCVEHPGLYSKAVSRFVLSEQSSLWLEMSLKIIRSMGVQRGKNDKIDAIRIALYAQRHQEDMKLYEPPRPIVEKLRLLLQLRKQLILSRNALQVPCNELSLIDALQGKQAMQLIRPSVNALQKNIDEVDRQIHSLIEGDEKLTHLFEMGTSVPGIGKITLAYLVCFTNEFKNYKTGKQLACYAGVVPFEYTSGKSVKGKPHVHNMANKLLKKQLHMGALAAVTYYEEFKTYYKRKLAEGKPKMLVLNNVRNKIILRLAAVIQKNQPYQKMTA